MITSLYLCYCYFKLLEKPTVPDETKKRIKIDFFQILMIRLQLMRNQERKIFKNLKV